MTVRTLRDAGNTPASWCREYLRSLRDYLLGFLQRTQPLQDSAAQVAKADEQFEADWAAGAVPGWADAGRGGPPSSAAAGALDVDAFDSVEELVQLGEGAQMPLASQPGAQEPNSLANTVCTVQSASVGLIMFISRCHLYVGFKFMAFAHPWPPRCYCRHRAAEGGATGGGP